MREQTNYLPKGALDVINDPNLKYSDRLKKTNYASTSIISPIKDSTEVVRAKAIAKNIYDAKGIILDDLSQAVKAIKQIKDAKQFYLVQSEFRKLSNGRGIGQYIVSFLGTVLLGVDLNIVESLRDGAAIVKHLTSIKADPITIKIINDRIAKASIQKTITALPGVSGSPVVSAVNAVNAVSMWTYEHNTWDTFINGANGKQDGLRAASYTTGGIVATTILALIPQTKPITGIIFGLLAADDAYRIANGKYDIETWVNLIIDLIGVIAGGAGSIVKGAIRPIAKLLSAIYAGVKGKALLPLIEAVQRIIGSFANTKFGQLLIKLGTGFISFITSLISKLCTQFIDALKLVAKKFPKLMSWCNRIITLIKSVTYSFGQFFGSVFKQSLKFIWHIISFPGKTASWIVQKLTPANPIVKAAFGTGAKVGVNFEGIDYILNSEFMNSMMPGLTEEEATALIAANMEATLLGEIFALPKSGNSIDCYNQTASGTYTLAGKYTIFKIPANINDTTLLQPCMIVMHLDSKIKNWIRIDITPSLRDYNNGNINQSTYWTDVRKLKQINLESLNKYITKK